MNKSLSMILVALLVVGSVAATGVLITSKTKEGGLNNAAYFVYNDGNLDAAEELYLSALEENPGYETARYNLATLYFQERKYDAAIPQLEALLEQDAANPHYHYDLAINLVANIRENQKGLDQFDRALDEFNTAEQLSPGFEHAAENIAVMERIKTEYAN